MIDWNGSGIKIHGGTVFSLSGPRGLHSARNNNRGQRNAYEAAVAAVLDLINRRSTGQILLEEIRRAIAANNRQIDVVPFDSANNAASGGNMTRATPFGEVVRDEIGNPRTHGGDNPATPQVERGGDVMHGTGQGITPTLLFDPRIFSPHLSVTAGFAADEVLFHELNHSKRQIQARSRQSAMGSDYHNSEEFAAIVATNIYSSEGGATWLRGNHRLRVPGSPFGEPGTIFDHDPNRIYGGLVHNTQHTESQRFAQRYRRELNEFARTDAQFCRRLGHVPAHFNPLREHFLNVGAIH